MVDKLYVMLPEFRVKKNYDIKAAWDDFYTDSANADIQSEIQGTLEAGLDDYRRKHPDDIDLNIDEYVEFLQNQGVKKYQLSVNARKRFSEWFNTRKSQYLLNKSIEKIKYDYNKKPQEQSREARNNALIDMMWGVLTNPDTTSKILNPGGFDKQKLADRIATILESMSEEDLAKEGYTINSLLQLSLDEADRLASKYEKTLNPLSPVTQVILHQQNMTGAKMIGIYANHNANHALMQHTMLAVDDENGAFFFAGKKKTSLHSIRNDKGDFISRNNANYLGASVDNVKDNTLFGTNQNTLTGDVSMLLSRLGYTPVEIAVLLKQPIVMDITKRFFREAREGKSIDAIIDEVIRSTAKYAKMYDNLTWSHVKNNPFELEPMMRDIMLYKDITKVSESNRTDFYRRQAAVGLLFKRIMNTSNALKELVQATRADTQNGGAGPTIADSMIKMQKVEDFIIHAVGERYPLINADIIRDNLRYVKGDEESLREQLLSSPLPFLQAFYTLGVRQSERMLGRYFPHFTAPFMEILNGRRDREGNVLFEGLREYTKTGKLNVKTINSICNDWLAYVMTATEFFGTSKNSKGEYITATQKRRDFINNFPDYFEKTVTANPDIADLEFVQRLKRLRANDKNPVDTIIFKNVGRLSPVLKERYMRDWASLLYMENPKARELALNLFLYSFYRNGFAFGPNSFTHLAPTVVREAIPGYISTLRSLLSNTNANYENFIEMYIYNHLDNRAFVPSISNDTTIEFTDSEGKIKDEVSIVIDTTSSYADKSIAKRIEKDSEGNSICDFFKFINRRIKGEDYYYRLTNTQDGNSATYSRIEPLGFKNSFLEYDASSTVLEMESVIGAKSSDPVEEYLARMEERNNVTEEMLDTQPSYDEEYTGSYVESLALQVAWEEIYREKLAPPPAMEGLNSIEANTEYKDANDDDVCGGVTIAVL